MRKKQIETLLQPVNKDGKLSVDQAVVKQAWEHVSARVRISRQVITVHLFKDKQPLFELFCCSLLHNCAVIVIRCSVKWSRGHSLTIC